MPDTAARLRNCFATLFPEIPEGQVETASVDTVAAWDSVAMVNLVSLVEEEFGISVEFEDMEKLTSFARVLAYLQAKLPA